MPPDDWGQLETISARIEDLQNRRLAVQKMGNVSRAEELRREVAAIQAEHDRLVDKITIRLAGAP